ncbi:MAG: hypothetical protein ABI846_13460 [Rudaea sp.]
MGPDGDRRKQRKPHRAEHADLEQAEERIEHARGAERAQVGRPGRRGGDRVIARQHRQILPREAKLGVVELVDQPLADDLIGDDGRVVEHERECDSNANPAQSSRICRFHRDSDGVTTDRCRVQ